MIEKRVEAEVARAVAGDVTPAEAARKIQKMARAEAAFIARNARRNKRMATGTLKEREEWEE